MTRVREKQEALLPSDMAKTDYLLMAFGLERHCYIKYSGGVRTFPGLMLTPPG